MNPSRPARPHLRLIRHAPSLAGVDFLNDAFLRLRIGIEDADDLIADIEQALR